MKRVAPLCAFVVVLAACGGASGLTKAEYDAKVSRLCLVAADQFRELHMDNSVAAWKYNAPTIIHIGQHFDHALAALKAPSDLAAGATAYLKANETVLADDKAAVAAATAGDGGSLRTAIRQANKDTASGSRSAKAIGATGCYIP